MNLANHWSLFAKSCAKRYLWQGISQTVGDDLVLIIYSVDKPLKAHNLQSVNNIINCLFGLEIMFYCPQLSFYCLQLSPQLYVTQNRLDCHFFSSYNLYITFSIAAFPAFRIYVEPFGVVGIAAFLLQNLYRIIWNCRYSVIILFFLFLFFLVVITHVMGICLFSIGLMHDWVSYPYLCHIMNIPYKIQCMSMIQCLGCPFIMFVARFQTSNFNFFPFFT